MSGSSGRSLRETLRLWADLEIEHVPLSMIKERPDLQPRNPAYIRHASNRLRRIATLEEMVKNLTQCLKEERSHNAPPIWLVVIDGAIYVVDGHHRLSAYKRARRQTIPSRVLRKENALSKALLASRLINTTGTRIALDPGEVREAAWLTISEKMGYGQRSWEQLQLEGYSFRSFAASFGCGVSYNTIRSMSKYVPRVAERPEVQKETWPSWRQAIAMLRPSEDEPEDEAEDDEQGRREQIERLKLRYMEIGQRRDAGIRKAAFREAEADLEMAYAFERCSIKGLPSGREDRWEDLPF